MRNGPVVTEGVVIVPAPGEVWLELAELFAADGDPRWCWYKWQVGARRQASSSVGARVS
jgi:hypothetical protein